MSGKTQESPWKPVEAAPIDGTPILVGWRGPWYVGGAPTIARWDSKRGVWVEIRTSMRVHLPEVYMEIEEAAP